MAKVIELHMESGRFYHVPLEQVAKHRAEYYAQKDTDTTFEDEMDFVMTDDYEGIDWYQNNMDPDEVKATLIKDVKPLKFEDEAVADIRIIEVEDGKAKRKGS